MCSLFWQMENDQGDLSDILRANSGGGGGGGGARSGGGGGGDGGVGGGLLGTGGINTPTTSGYGWTFPTDPAVNFPTRPGDQIDDFSSVGCGAAHGQLLQESEMMNSMFYSGDNPLLVRKDNDSYSDNPFGDSLMGQEMKPCQLLTRMIQIGPRPKIPAPAHNASAPSSLSSPGSKPLSEALKVNSIGGSTENASLHMNSPRNPGIKRRKSQMKKVVCIPAPAAASNRPSGEVVPSDLWAWRKYGQKPIKGSPYPRGYYRCSSSKGCSARKQVERSRNDPNMLVITYTSEHNHPWPTQRNALAGSTRSQTMKAASASKAFTPPPSRTPNAEDAVKEESIRDNVNDTENEGCVKDEMGDVDKSMEIDDGELSQDFHESYRPTPPDLSQSDDFFSELGELEPDPLSLIFPHGLGDQKPNHEDSEDKDLDPFSLFEWSESSFSGARRGL
ncbi:probable WRKY transcription factor 14 [Nymphaea colorata]|nr:probable WRKY transcription factor 14 [Nymphaea colorata]